MNEPDDKKTAAAQVLVDDFLKRTGISDPEGDSNRRYLWTDAFAVESCFALSRILKQEKYSDYALKLIRQVHLVLGKHRPDDSRKGWISGLSAEEGEKHPTIGGLRIGKQLPERKNTEQADPQLEWERDGQYFHYLTRWFNALMIAHEQTGDKKYAVWAVELLKAASAFIEKSNNTIRMVWKMNTGLTEPTVESMGAHDPLEGLICAIKAMQTVPEKKEILEPMKNDLEIICQGRKWATSDPLGTGGLLLNTQQTAALKSEGITLPHSIKPGYLFSETLASLKSYSQDKFSKVTSAQFRLAFRECGLSLGIRVLNGQKEKYSDQETEFDKLDRYTSLADEIEQFWMTPENQNSTTWQGHLDINAITLASSLLANNYPEAF